MLLGRYNYLAKKRENIIKEINYIEIAINDKHTNYVDRREYQNDLIYLDQRLMQLIKKLVN